MRSGHLRRVGALAAVTALGVTGLATVGASASDRQGEDEGTAATITMVANGKNLEFQGPRTVSSGSKLSVIDATDPKKVGPHTFSLFEKDLVPRSKDELKECFKFQSEVCVNVGKAHKVNFEKEKVGKIDVDVGKDGWDSSFGKKGDTWFSLAEGDEVEREVSAEPGTTLFYVCVIHPFMQGKIKVTK